MQNCDLSNLKPLTFFTFRKKDETAETNIKGESSGVFSDDSPLADKFPTENLPILWLTIYFFIL